MWNHAPVMWAAMRKEGINPPAVSEAQAADLFAFLSSSRYFERAADAGRGRRLFEAKHCSGCHALAGAGGPGLPVSAWTSIADPIALMQGMWNHAGQMKQAFADKNIKWQRLEPQELADIVLMLQSMPSGRKLAPTLNFSASPNGAQLFQSKGCANCHSGSLALEGRLANRTILDVAAAMWNHAPKMVQLPPSISAEEMRGLVGYVWARQFFKASGDPRKGESVFRARNCAMCHDSGQAGAPSLRASGQFSAIRMVAALWKHGPKMLDEMERRKIAWPQLSAGDLSNLVAYLDARK
jgi:mono/diheme cytochrome c family protein